MIIGVVDVRFLATVTTAYAKRAALPQAWNAGNVSPPGRSRPSDSLQQRQSLSARTHSACVHPPLLDVSVAYPGFALFGSQSLVQARFCMKVHAYVREKMLYGLRVQTGTPAAPRRQASGKPKPAATEDAPAADSSALPPRVYQKYADFIPAYAVASGMTIADLNQPHIDIQDSQVLTRVR